MIGPGQQWQTLGLSICTLISWNQGLEKSNLDFLQVWHQAFLQGGDMVRKSRFSESKSFLGFEVDNDFSRPWFSEIRVQLKGRLSATVDQRPITTMEDWQKVGPLNVAAGVLWTLVVEFNRSWFQSHYLHTCSTWFLQFFSLKSLGSKKLSAL